MSLSSSETILNNFPSRSTAVEPAEDALNELAEDALNEPVAHDEDDADAEASAAPETPTDYQAAELRNRLPLCEGFDCKCKSKAS